MRIGVLLSARQKATRLPGKSMLDFGGYPLVVWLLKRLSRARRPESVVLSTSRDPRDQVLVDAASAHGFSFFQGSEDDKLDRYFHTAQAFGFDAVIIVDGDDPFCFPEVVDLVAERLSQNDVDCVYVPGLPLGAASTGLMTRSLEKVLRIKASSDTEVWGDYFIKSPYFSSTAISIDNPLWKHPHIRLTLDYAEDYQMISQTLQYLGRSPDFSSSDLMTLLLERPELCRLNEGAQKKYEVHLSQSSPVIFKTDPEYA